MDAVLSLLPVAAVAFAVPQFLPQFAAVRRTGDTAGVSWAWAALTSVSNGGWIAYFALSQYWAALVAATSTTILAGALALLLARAARPRSGPAAAASGWVVLLALTWAVAGREGLGAVLAVSFVVQVAPSVWSAYRTDRPTGVSRGTWLLILGELSCFGVYGVHQSDPRLTALGGTGVVASLLMLARTRRGAVPVLLARKTR